MIVDHAIKHKTPVFVMGNVEELEKLWETLPKQMFTDIFIRPINVVEMVENINNGVFPHEKEGRIHVGIANSYRRIHYFYGDRGKLSVESMPGEGTCFQIIIPREADDELTDCG